MEIGRPTEIALNKLRPLFLLFVTNVSITRVKMTSVGVVKTSSTDNSPCLELSHLDEYIHLRRFQTVFLLLSQQG